MAALNLPLNSRAPKDAKGTQGSRSPSAHSMSSYSTNVGDRDSEDSCNEDVGPVATPAMLWPATPSPTAFVMSHADPFNLITAPDQSGFGFGMLMPTPSKERVKLNVLALPFTPACMAEGAASTEAETGAAWPSLEVNDVPSTRLLEGLQSPAELPPVPPMPPVPVPEEASALPSLGSTLHGSGECKPCAWLWKPRGCANAHACDYCHLCPEGELKKRKKVKVAALRAANA